MERDIAALFAFIDARRAMPYAWGRGANDCVSFTLRAVEAQTGTVVAPKLKWKSQASAFRLIRRLGGLEAAFDAHFDRIPPAQAMRGDIGAVSPEAMIGVSDELAQLLGVHPMIVEGTTLVCPSDDRGLRRAKRAAMVCAWSAVKVKPNE